MQAQQQPSQTELPEWQRHLRERLLTGKGHAFDALLSEIPAEEALTAIRDILLPETQTHEKTLVFRNNIGLLAIFPLIAFLTAWRVGDVVNLNPLDPRILVPLGILGAIFGALSFKARRLLRLWARCYLLLPELLPRVQTGNALSALIDFVGWFGTFGDTVPVHASTPMGFGTIGAIDAASRVSDAHTNLKRTARQKMTQLLGRLSVEEAKALTENNRLVLLKLAQKAEDEVDMGIAALLVLGTMGEARVRPVAQKLTKSFLPRVREAAKECLGQLKG
jgi:hypothetical protein